MARGDFSHLEIPVDDPSKVLPFYGALFGWEFGTMQAFGDYHLFRMPGSNPGGAIGRRGVTAGDRLGVAIEVDSIATALATTVEFGGSVVRGKAEVTGFGWSAIVADPEGGEISIFEPARPAPGAEMPPLVRQMRLVVTTAEYDTAVRFYRDTLGLREELRLESEDGRVAILDAGRATLEIGDLAQRASIDRVEVGRPVAGPIRVAFEVADVGAATARLVSAGATELAPPTPTPWSSLNARLEGPAGLQLTLFQELGEG